MTETRVPLDAPSAGPVDEPAVLSGVERLTSELGRYNRLAHRLKAQLSAGAPTGLDWGAFTLLIFLVKNGPQRQGELAELALLDPSTVSRRVQQLVQLGYVERRPHPVDGRAVQLAATPPGEAIFERIVARRHELMAGILTRWPGEDVDALSRLLERLNDDLEIYLPSLQRTSATDPLPEFPPSDAKTRRPMNRSSS